MANHICRYARTFRGLQQDAQTSCFCLSVFASCLNYFRANPRPFLSQTRCKEIRTHTVRPCGCATSHITKCFGFEKYILKPLRAWKYKVIFATSFVDCCNALALHAPRNGCSRSGAFSFQKSKEHYRKGFYFLFGITKIRLF